VVQISNADARRLLRLLDDASALARQHAAEQSYRRDACAATRERILANYHQMQAEGALALADRAEEFGALLADRTPVGH
jgi:hypothetical protein